MSDQQEGEILTMVKERSLQLIDLYDIAGDTHSTLGMLSKQLGNILTVTEKIKNCDNV
jgi:hypothetical protein